MPETDLLVYSFPCQDLSTGGLGKGMAKGSGTRSGLLWEIERILKELKELGRLPEYLLLENVKTIKAHTNIADLNQWLEFLSSIGYYNDECMILNSLDFGIPQDRERAFIVSHLGSKLDVPSRIESKKKERSYNIHDFIITDYDRNPQYRTEADMAQLNKTPSRDVMWEINGIDPIADDITNEAVNQRTLLPILYILFASAKAGYQYSIQKEQSPPLKSSVGADIMNMKNRSISKKEMYI